MVISSLTEFKIFAKTLSESNITTEYLALKYSIDQDKTFTKGYLDFNSFSPYDAIDIRFSNDGYKKENYTYTGFNVFNQNTQPFSDVGDYQNKFFVDHVDESHGEGSHQYYQKIYIRAYQFDRALVIVVGDRFNEVFNSVETQDTLTLEWYKINTTYQPTLTPPTPPSEQEEECCLKKLCNC